MQLTKIDIATSRVEAMRDFYAKVFQIEFEEVVHKIGERDWKHYLGKIGSLEFFICPNEPAGTKPEQAGVHQFHIKIEDVESLINRAERLGIPIQEVPFGPGEKNYCLRDPDNHPWIIS